MTEILIENKPLDLGTKSVSIVFNFTSNLKSLTVVEPKAYSNVITIPDTSANLNTLKLSIYSINITNLNRVENVIVVVSGVVVLKNAYIQVLSIKFGKGIECRVVQERIRPTSLSVDSKLSEVPYINGYNLPTANVSDNTFIEVVKRGSLLPRNYINGINLPAPHFFPDLVYKDYMFQFLSTGGYEDLDIIYADSFDKYLNKITTTNTKIKPGAGNINNYYGHYKVTELTTYIIRLLGYSGDVFFKDEGFYLGLDSNNTYSDGLTIKKFLNYIFLQNGKTLQGNTVKDLNNIKDISFTLDWSKYFVSLVSITSLGEEEELKHEDNIVKTVGAQYDGKVYRFYDPSKVRATYPALTLRRPSNNSIESGKLYFFKENFQARAYNESGTPGYIIKGSEPITIEEKSKASTVNPNYKVSSYAYLKVSVKMKFDGLSLEDLDVAKPIYIKDLASLFLINKISKFTPNGITDVELIKLK